MIDSANIQNNRMEATGITVNSLDKHIQDSRTTSNPKNLLQLVDSMLEASVAIHILSFFRNLKRQGMADYLPDFILQTPLQSKEIFQFIIDNEETVYDQRSLYAKMYLELYSFQMIREKYGRRLRSDEKDFPDTIILDFNDSHQDTELVYSISINHAEKYVVRRSKLVTFRGSLTIQDWKTNFNPAMKVMENPIQELRNVIPTLQIHAGFYDYLFKLIPKPTIQKPNTNRSKEINDVVGAIQNDQSTTNKFQVIFEQLKDLFLEYPDYRVYSTGHSLGGALSLIFAYKVACWSLPNNIEGGEKRIPSPITCVTFASPKVGNIDFCKTFNHLEKKGVIRLIRITNCYDPVPRLPIRAHFNDWCFVCRLRNLYIHVGVHIELKKGETKIRPEYTPQIKSWQSLVMYTSKRLLFFCFHIAFLCTSIAANFGCVALRYHSCLDYYDLVREHENALQQLNLDEIFTNELENEQKQTQHTA